MDQTKHPDHVLLAYLKLASEFPELRLVFSGTGPYLNVLRRMVSVAPKEILDRISITYLWNKEKFKLLKESLLLVYPSVMEAFPLTTLEALACETPFLGYDIPALKEQVQETGGGILVHKNNVEELTEVLRHLLSNRSKILNLASRGRKAVEYKFTWEKTVDSLLKAIG